MQIKESALQRDRIPFVSIFLCYTDMYWRHVISIAEYACNRIMQEKDGGCMPLDSLNVLVVDDEVNIEQKVAGLREAIHSMPCALQLLLCKLDC
jgi:hypothetical protein